MLKWLQSSKKQNQAKKNQEKLKTQSKENIKTNPDQLTEHIRIIAADHPEQTVQLLKQWLKD